jgi:hypothetical protein
VDSSELLAATSSGSNCMKRRQLQMSLAEDSIPAVATAADPVVAATAPVVLAADPEPEQVVATAELAPAAVPASPVAASVAAAVPPPPPPPPPAAAAVPAAVAAVPVAPVVPVAAPVTAPVAPVAPVAAAVAVAPSDASKLLQQIFDEIEKLSRVHGIFDADADGTVSAADLVAIAKG